MNQVQMSEVRFCAQCGSASVDFSSLSGATAVCRGCNWSGPADELLVVPIQSGMFLQAESALVGFIDDIRNMLAGELGQVWLRVLLKWGFLQCDPKNITGTLDRKKLSRFIVRIAHATAIAVIQERELQETEERRRLVS